MDKDKIYDVVVIGAGIHGAGVAQAACTQGWSVAVVDQHSGAAAETSSKSSKLIHGGLRYLESMQFELVRECLRERALLCKLAPELVHMRSFIIPLLPSNKRGTAILYLGLLLYWAMSGFKRSQFPHRISARHLAQKVPELSAEKCRGALLYKDAQTDDHKLTNAVLNSAKKMGADTYFDHEVRRVNQTGDFFKIEFNGEHEPLITRSLVNAAGPWVNSVAEKIHPPVPQHDIELVQGSHIILRRPAPAFCVYCESPEDSRPVFVLPWYGQTLIGTTELPQGHEPKDIAATDQEIQYLLDTYNKYFPQQRASKKDLAGSFAGLRVLPIGSDSVNKRSRETVLITRISSPSYIGIYGGKLTAYRLTALKVVEQLALKLPTQHQTRSTDTLMLASN